jgi:hypothetical protein
MHPDMQKEQFSRAYVQAVAACAGFAWGVPSVDDDSVDMALFCRGGGGTIRSPRLELQLKCKSAPPVDGETFSHLIKLKNYDDLRDQPLLVPRILVIVLIPDLVDDWLHHDEAQLVLRRCAYWTSLRGFPPSENLSGQTIKIPRRQMFNVQALQSLMKRIGEGELP